MSPNRSFQPTLPASTLPSAMIAMAMDLIPEPIVITTIDGVITYSNRAAQELFQGAGNLQTSTPASELVNVSMHRWLQAVDWTQILYRMRSGQCDLEAQLNLSDSPKVVSIALRHISQDSVCPTLDSSPDLWLWRIQDLTPQQQQQAEWIERTAQLERSSRHMSEFLSNMSHELRTPLTSILGFSSMLKQQIFGELNEKQSVYIRQIHRSGQYLLALINDILDLSKIEAGQMTLECTPLSAVRLCEEAIESVQQQSQLKQLSVRTQFEPSLGQLWADELRVRQMILNLLSNAIKFSSEGGTIEVRSQQQGKQIWIEVQDYGIGIEAEKQHLVFKPFQQVDNSIERRRQGTGLGLALTKHLAELHGGTVSFTSEMGTGSCFVLKLPMVEDRP